MIILTELPIAPIGRVIKNRDAHSVKREYMRKTELPIAPVGRIIKNAGAQRVSEDAKKALARYLEYNAEEIVSRAITVEKHSGIKTVEKDSITEVVNHYHFHNPKNVVIGSNYGEMNVFEYIDIQDSFNKIYQQNLDDETKKYVKLIQEELKKDKVNTSKIKSSIDWLKGNASSTIFPLIQIILNLYGLTLPH